MKRVIELSLLAGILGLALFLRNTDPAYLADLSVIPDSPQYTTSAYNLLHGRGLWIYINNIKLPLQYPCGFPLILCLFYMATGAALHQAVCVVTAFSIIGILLLYIFARSAFGVSAAVFAALLLSVAPSTVGYSQLIIGHIPANAFTLAAVYLAWRAATGGGGFWIWLCSGVLCGFATSVHLINGIALVPVLAACALSSPRKGRVIAACAGFLIGFSPVLIYNSVAFGSIFTTGYDYWMRWGGGRRNLSLLYAIKNTAVSERGDQRGNIIYYMWHFMGMSWPTLFAPYFFGVMILSIFGASSCLGGRRFRLILIASLSMCTASVAALIASGTAVAEMAWVYPACLVAAWMASVLITRAAQPYFPPSDCRGVFYAGLICVLLVLANVVFLFCYSFQMAKFLLPSVPFVCLMAGQGIVVLVSLCRGAGLRPVIMRIPVALLIAVTAWGCWKPMWGLRLSPRAPRLWYEGMMALDGIAPQDSCLVSAIDGVYATHYFVKDTNRMYIPISRDVEYVAQRNLPLIVAVENPGVLTGLMASGRRIYMDGFTYGWWSRYRASLERDFSFTPVASYCGGSLRIYEIAPRPNNSTS